MIRTKIFVLFNTMWTSFLKILERNTQETSHKISFYSIASFIGFYSFYLLNPSLTPESYENTPLRLIAGLLCIPLMLKKYWPISLRKWLPLYWHFTILYNSPFFFAFMLFKNNFNLLWSLNSLITVTVTLLLVDWITGLILLMLGAFLAWICYILTTDSIFIPDTLDQLFSSYLCIAIYMGRFFFTEKKVQQQKLQTMKALAGAIAHEMRTPLSALGTGFKGIKKHLPALFSNYQAAQKAGLDAVKIDIFHYKALENLPDSMEKLIRQAHTVIDMLLLKVKDDPLSEPLQCCSISQCLQKVMEDYPFDPEQRELVTCTTAPDFTFQGNPELMMHVFFNLFKNGLYYIAAANKGTITIWTEITADSNIVKFKDTGMGIPAKNLPFIFEKFYSKTKHGSGLGLAFCKLVIESFNGTMACQSVEGSYTEFSIQFPKDKSKNVSNTMI